MASYELEMSYYIHVEGTPEFVEELRDKLDDAVYDLLPIHCGESECCPEPPGENYIPSAVGSSRINPIKEQEDE